MMFIPSPALYRHLNTNCKVCWETSLIHCGVLSRREGYVCDKVTEIKRILRSIAGSQFAEL